MPLIRIYEDDFLLAIDKPLNLHVHPSKLSRREKSVQDLLEEELGFRVYPIHRLDRPVGGVLLLAKTKETASVFGDILRNRKVWEKTYLAIVRGWMEGKGQIDHPLSQAQGKPPREAQTSWRALARAELPWSDGQFPTSRYTLVLLNPITGRHHQIRRHLASVNHPIMGDIARGDNPKNRIWREKTNIPGLMLRAISLSFIHPFRGERIVLEAPVDQRFVQAAMLCNWDLSNVGFR